LYQHLRHRGIDFEKNWRNSSFADQLLQVDSSLEDIIYNEGFSSEFFLAPGVPRIRPVLVYLSSEVGRVDSKVDVENNGLNHLAMSAELFYCAILVHDVALGKQGGRRRRLAKRLLGKAIEWYGGNRLITRALEMVMLTKSSEIMSEFVMSMREVQEARDNLAEWEDRLPKEGEVLAFAENYTGSMFAFSCRAGGLLAQASRRQVNLLGRFGRKLGVAWQLTEELAIFDGPEALQALEEQIATNRPFYSIALAAEHDEEISRKWKELRQQDNEPLLKELLEEVRSTNTRSITRQKIAECSWTARTILSKLPESEQRSQLDQIAQALAK
jgi:octaprenyl-diphosphate synthase